MDLTAKLELLKLLSFYIYIQYQSIFFKLQCDQMESKGAQQGGGGKKGVTVSRPESKVALLIGQGISESHHKK